MLYTPSYGYSQLKMEILEFTSKGGGGPFDVIGGPFVVLEILKKNSRFWNIFGNFEFVENFENYELKFPK